MEKELLEKVFKENIFIDQFELQNQYLPIELLAREKFIKKLTKIRKYRGLNECILVRWKTLEDRQMRGTNVHIEFKVLYEEVEPWESRFIAKVKEGSLGSWTQGSKAKQKTKWLRF